MSIDRGTDEEDVVHIFHGILLSHDITPSAATRMNLGTVILSKVSQTEKNKCHMVSLICGIFKKL